MRSVSALAGAALKKSIAASSPPRARNTRSEKFLMGDFPVSNL
jgi:hypothetical protein